MKISIHQVTPNALIKHNDINFISNFNTNCTLAIDGSTTNTGIAIVDNITATPLATISCKREEKLETAVEYKVKFKRLLSEIFNSNKLIINVGYEEPFMEYIQVAKILLMLRSSVEELIAEHDHKYDYIKYEEIANKRWKKIFLYPDKIPSGGTTYEKVAVKNKLCSSYPFMEELTQDEIDATALGISIVKNRLSENGIDLSSFKVKPFAYQIQFIGANNDAEMFETFNKLKLPKVPFENGTKLVEINGQGIFEKKIYKEMGNEDKMLILKFKNTSNGNLSIKYHEIVPLIKKYSYIYAVINRKNRKNK